MAKMTLNSTGLKLSCVIQIKLSVSTMAIRIEELLNELKNENKQLVENMVVYQKVC